MTRFINQNPRNLELMGIQHRPSGNCFEKKREIMNSTYNAIFSGSKSHTEASIYHHKSGLILTASTKEHDISSQLFSNTDRFAAFNIGRILADRLKKCGIEMIVPCFEKEEVERSQKKQAFLRALIENGIKIKDYGEVEPSIVDKNRTWVNYKQYHTRQEKLDEIL
uniref:39S ribosomal protein L18, mitochondrial (inferred by orthology to a C. elegans protein) n=1 Tax=Strongyloides venezuelensis TaxID=75913 RepID=A0A0K0F8M7_STRVS